MEHRATIITDLSFGDSGKGSITDFHARQQGATAVVRFNGGAQAGHNVVTQDGKQHTFSQFGSATLVDNTVTHLSRFMLVNPLRMFEEASRLEQLGVVGAIYRVTIDEDALVVTPYHEAANRIREALRGNDRHGSCGHGIGETMSDSIDYPQAVLRVKDLRSAKTSRQKLEAIRQLKLDQLSEYFDQLRDDELVARDIDALLDDKLTSEVVNFYKVFVGTVRIVRSNYLAKLLKKHCHVVFEGAQGVLLDEWYGFHPYTTWSTTTNQNANTLLAESGFDGEIVRLGLMRAYSTRHGAGPFVTEDATLNSLLNDNNNPLNPWQENMRFGHLDLVALRYAISIASDIDALVVSHLDELVGMIDWATCSEYADSNTTIAKLQRCGAPDLDYQSRLTEMLFKALPILTTVIEGPFSQNDTASYLEHVQEELGKPIKIISTGPTAEDKVCF